MPVKRVARAGRGVVRTKLDGAWTLSGVSEEGDQIEVRASVPGAVHWDLERAGVIPNAFIADAEAQVQWVAQQSWKYSRAFRIGRAALAAEHVELVFEGLDTFARITLNGKALGRTDNMFIPHRFEVKGLLRAGKNTIQVEFKSPVEAGLKLHGERGGVKLYEGPNNPRAYVRKAQYSFGWDWGPTLTTSGIWRSVYLESWSGARIESVYWRTLEADEKRARVAVSVECAGKARCGGEARLRRGRKVFSARLKGTGSRGGGTLRCTIEIDKPDLWWPAGQGRQDMYTAEAQITSGGRRLDADTRQIGLRTVELRREADEEGESFALAVNGRALFAKGANWIPADTYLPRLSAGDYDEWVRLAASANMNMLRVWGGGIYEDEAFYRSCDKRGVMVWQDFMFACAMCPEGKWFLRNVKREAESAVKALRNHPSIVLWCGNNENHWAARSWWPDDPFGGKTIYDELLPKICGRHDPSRPYWPGSPYGGKDPNCAERGDRHSWDVWSGWKDYRHYLSDDGRFVSEFGFQGCPEMETVAEFGPVEEMHYQHPLFERHNKQVEGPERLARFLAGSFRMPVELEDFVYLTQVLQAEAIKTGVLHWRSRMMKTAGALYWQLNDCWPVTSWAAVDYRRRPKALYYYTRSFFAPVAVRAAVLADGVSAWVINDSRRRLEGQMVIQCMTVEGVERAAVREQVDVKPNSAYRIGPFNAEIFDITDTARQFIVATLQTAAGAEYRDTAFLARPKHMRIGEAGIEYGVRSEGGVLTVEISAGNLAYAVYLRLPGTRAVFSDNFFTLLPGETREIEVTGSELTAAQASRRLEVKWVKGGL